MFKETNRIRLSFLLAFLSACAFHCTAQSETITSGLSVYIPSFEERFDWSFNYGGNDGGSSLEDYTQETLKRENTSFSNCKHGYQCVEVGNSNSVGAFIISGNSVAGKYYTYRVMLYDYQPVYIKNNKSVVKGTSFLRGKCVDNATSFEITSGNGNKNHNFYLDDVFLYSLSNNKADLYKKASRLLVAGKLNNAMLKDLQEIAAQNKNLTSIDLASASMATGAEKVKLTLANPNCLIYDPNAAIVTNTENVVKTTVTSDQKFDIINNYKCENLVIRDGYPFDAMYSFTAEKASYDRTFKNTDSGYMSTVCLPFTVEKAQTDLRNIYGFSEYNNSSYSVAFSSQDKIEACKPYVVEVVSPQPFMNLHDVFVCGTTPLDIFKCEKGISTNDLNENKKYQFHGTFSETDKMQSSDTRSVYGFQGGRFVYVGTADEDAVNFKPFRAYFTIDKTVSQAASRVLELDGVINEVEKIKTNNKNIKSDVFNTEGVKVKSKVDSATLNNLSNGIYIIGGKKVMVKH